MPATANRFAKLRNRLQRFYACASNGEAPLWTVWWLGGIPLGWATSALVITAEFAREGGHHAWGDLLDVARLVVFFIWARLAWRCAHNVEQGFWTPVARLALGGGVVCMAMI